MGYLKDDVLHLQGDLRHILNDVENFKGKLEKDHLSIAPLEDLLTLGDFLAHVGDLESHVNDVIAHIGHVGHHLAAALNSPGPEKIAIPEKK